MRYLNAILKLENLSNVIKTYRDWPGYAEQYDSTIEKIDKVKEELESLGYHVDLDHLGLAA
jgi:hypothetical protein